MKKRIVHISVNPISIFAGVLSFVYSLLATMSSYFQLIKLTASGMLFEVVDFYHLTVILTPLGYFLAGYIVSYIIVVLYNVLAKYTGGISVELHDQRVS